VAQRLHQQVACLDHAAAEDDDLLVEELDQVGHALGEPVADLAEGLDRDGVDLLGGRGHHRAVEGLKITDGHHDQ
jgi:hypothetical protein